MAEIINLNKARKAKSKLRAKADAGTNLLSFGRSKNERQATKISKLRAERSLDGHKLED